MSHAVPAAINIPKAIVDLMNRQKDLMKAIEQKEEVDIASFATRDADLFVKDLDSQKSKLASIAREISSLRATLKVAYSVTNDPQLVDEKKVLNALCDQERKLRNDPRSCEEWKTVAKAFVHKVEVSKLTEKDLSLFADAAFATQWRLDQCYAQSLAAQEVAIAADEWAALTESQRMAIIMQQSN
jgi:hypothetical protein